MFYQSAKNEVMAVDIRTNPAFQAGQPRALFELRGSAAPANAGPTVFGGEWDVAPDGAHFVVIKAPERGAGTKLQVVTDWFEELRQRVPVRQ